MFPGSWPYPASAAPTTPLHPFEQIGHLDSSIPPERDAYDLAILDIDLLEERLEEFSPRHRIARPPRLDEPVERQRGGGAPAALGASPAGGPTPYGTASAWWRVSRVLPGMPGSGQVRQLA